MVVTTRLFSLFLIIMRESCTSPSLSVQSSVITKDALRGIKFPLIDLTLMVGFVWNLSLLQAIATTTRTDNTGRISFIGAI
jgi:hypothetical protein